MAGQGPPKAAPAVDEVACADFLLSKKCDSRVPRPSRGKRAPRWLFHPPFLAPPRCRYYLAALELHQELLEGNQGLHNVSSLNKFFTSADNYGTLVKKVAEEEAKNARGCACCCWVLLLGARPPPPPALIHAHAPLPTPPPLPLTPPPRRAQRTRAPPAPSRRLFPWTACSPRWRRASKPSRCWSSSCAPQLRRWRRCGGRWTARCPAAAAAAARERAAAKGAAAARGAPPPPRLRALRTSLRPPPPL